MYIMKKILVKSAISLFAGMASAVGVQLVNTMWKWNRCSFDESDKKEQAPA